MLYEVQVQRRPALERKTGLQDTCIFVIERLEINSEAIPRYRV